MNLNTVIEMNKGLIISCTKKFYHADPEDLYQAGVLGLLKAYKNYHFDGHTKFSSYAYKYIYGEMYLLTCNHHKDLIKLANLIEKTRYTLAQKINKIPTDDEIAQFLKIPVTQIKDALLIRQDVLSLDNDENKSLYDTIKCEDNIDDKVMILNGLNHLTDEEKQIIVSRYYHDMTQDEVAKKLSLSQVTISRKEKQGLNKLHDILKV